MSNIVQSIQERIEEKDSTDLQTVKVEKYLIFFKVTGGSSGIGKCVAIIAAKYGANVTIIARNVQRLEAAKNEILLACENKDVQRVEYLSLDIGANYGNVEKALTDLERTMGPIYMLVNCAGTATSGKIEDTTIEDLDKMLHINLLGTYYCIKAVAQRMKASREGAIVLTGSQASLIGICIQICLLSQYSHLASYSKNISSLSHRCLWLLRLLRHEIRGSRLSGERSDGTATVRYFCDSVFTTGHGYTRFRHRGAIETTGNTTHIANGDISQARSRRGQAF